MSYSDITLELDIKSRDAIKRAILCTVEGRKIKLGRKGYLGDVDEKLFIDTIKEQAHDLNCFTLSEAVDLAAKLHNLRYKKASILLFGMSTNNQALHTKIDQPGLPNKSWVREITFILALLRSLNL